MGLLTPGLAGVTDLDSGIGVHFRHLADALTATGTRVTACVVSEKKLCAPPDLGFAVRTIHVPKPLRARLLGKLNWQFHQYFCVRAGIAAARQAALAIAPDIWETTATGSLALDYVRVRQRAPLVTRVSTTAAQLRATNAGPRNWIGRKLEQWEHDLVRHSDRVLTHSRSHLAAIVQEFSLTESTVGLVPHGIPIPPPSEKASSSSCTLLFVGRTEHRKGIDLLLGALPAALRASPQLRAVLAGADHDHYWQTHWEKTAPSEVRDRVHFAGRVSAAELERRYREADIFVAPSRYESFGLIFAEAMAYGLPVVALRAPGAVDLIEDDRTGRLVPPEDIPALSSAIIELAASLDLRRRLGTAAHATASERYSLPALAAASVAYYRDTLASAA